MNQVSSWRTRWHVDSDWSKINDFQPIKIVFQKMMSNDSIILTKNVDFWLVIFFDILTNHIRSRPIVSATVWNDADITRIDLRPYVCLEYLSVVSMDVLSRAQCCVFHTIQHTLSQMEWHTMTRWRDLIEAEYNSCTQWQPIQLPMMYIDKCRSIRIWHVAKWIKCHHDVPDDMLTLIGQK